jgi:hypothetical protein
MMINAPGLLYPEILRRYRNIFKGKEARKKSNEEQRDPERFK